MYYKTTLNIHNLSYFDLRTKQGNNYIWPETEGTLDCNQFVSIQMHHLDKQLTKHPDITEAIQWSDNCMYQNKSKELSSGFVTLAEKCSVIITQKFLEPSHTHMEVDSIAKK